MTGAPSRILLIQHRQLGDLICASALLQDLRAAFPAAQVDFNTGAKGAELMRGNPFLSEVVVYDPGHVMRSARTIRARRYDWIVDGQSSPRSAPLVLFSGASRRVGWDIGLPWGPAYTDHVPRGPTGFTVRDRQRMLEQLGVPIAARRPLLFLDESERAQGVADVAAIGTPAGRPRVGILVSAGNPASVWPVERFAELATRLAASDLAPIVISTRGDEAAAARCLNLARGAFRADVPGLRRFLGFIAGLDLLITNDTGPAHMAMSLDVPSVTLYGPSLAEHWNHGLPTSAAVSSPRLLCKACIAGRVREGRTGLGHTCMNEIEVEPVHTRALEVLSATASRRQS